MRDMSFMYIKQQGVTYY